MMINGQWSMVQSCGNSCSTDFFFVLKSLLSWYYYYDYYWGWRHVEGQFRFQSSTMLVTKEAEHSFSSPHDVVISYYYFLFKAKEKNKTKHVYFLKNCSSHTHSCWQLPTIFLNSTPAAIVQCQASRLLLNHLREGKTSFFFHAVPDLCHKNFRWPRFAHNAR